MQSYYLMSYSSTTIPTKVRTVSSLAKILFSCLLLLSGSALFAQVDFCPNLPAGNVETGQQISIPVTSAGINSISSIQATFVYDPSLLEYTGFTSVEASSDANLVNPGELRFVFVDESPDLSGSTHADGTDFVTLNFNVLSNHSDPQVSIETEDTPIFFEAVNIDAISQDMSICGVIVVNTGNSGGLQNRVEACVRTNTEAVNSGDGVSFPIWIGDVLNLLDFSFQIDYDASLYQFDGITPNDDFPDVIIDASVSGQLQVSWSSTEPIINAHMLLGDFNFTALANIEDPTIEVNQDPSTSSFSFLNGNTGVVETCLNTAFDPLAVVDFCAQIPQGSFAAGSVIDIPVHVSNFNGIGWLSLPFNFSNSQLQVLEIDQTNTNPNFGFTWNNTEDGVTIIGIEWTGTGYSLPDGEQLLTISLQALEDIDEVVFELNNNNNFFVANDFEISITGEASYCNQFYVGNLPANAIASIYFDEFNNCTANPNATALIDWTINYTDNTTGETFSATTGINGNAYASLPIGTYTYSWSAPTTDPIWDICSGGTIVVNDPESVQYISSSTNAESTCPQLTVSLSSFNLRPCFENNRFRIRYANYGSAIAQNAYVDVVFDPAYVPNSASIPFTSLGNNFYRFQLGDLAVASHGSFFVTGDVDCNFPVGAAICAEATIYPFRTVCTPVDGNFLGGDVKVTSQCDGDSVKFRIQNIGDGPTGLINFTVIEDVIIYMDQPSDIQAGEFIELSVPANGATYRLEAERPNFAPYISQGLAIQEGCGTLPGGGISTGFVTGLPLLDGDLYFDRYCQETSAAYDPNDKQAIPAGVGNANIIEPNQRMDYKIRFQNTGTDTAFNIVIIDTIDTQVLDLTTFRAGIGSHDYYVQIEGNEVRFIFDDIQLVDSLTNERLSHGFVHFSIAQQADLDDGTVLSNRAGIYFDFNEPILTNFSTQTIGREVLISKVTSYNPVAETIKAFPSPTYGQLFFDLADINGPVELMVFDMLGRNLMQQTLVGDRPSIDLSKLAAGRYGYRLMQQGQLLQTGIVTKQ